MGVSHDPRTFVYTAVWSADLPALSMAGSFDSQTLADELLLSPDTWYSLSPLAAECMSWHSSNSPMAFLVLQWALGQPLVWWDSLQPPETPCWAFANDYCFISSVLLMLNHHHLVSKKKIDLLIVISLLFLKPHLQRIFRVRTSPLPVMWR